MFTSFPIVWFAIFDLQHHKDHFLNDPLTYRIGLDNKCFGTKVFWKWFCYGIFQALALFYIGFYAAEESLNAGNGSNSSLWRSGSIVYAGVVVIANLKILDQFHSYEPRAVTYILVSMLLYFLFFYLDNAPWWDNEQLIGVFKQTMTDGVAWLAMVWCAGMVYTVDRMVWIVIEWVEDAIEQRKKK